MSKFDPTKEDQVSGKKWKRLRRIGVMTSAVIIIGIVMSLATGGFAIAGKNTTIWQWQHVGGAPCVPGGVQSQAQAEALLNDLDHPCGIQSLGYSVVQAKAAAVAEISDCKIYGWMILDKMLFAGGQVRQNVQLTDKRFASSGLPSYCFSIPVMSGDSKVDKSTEKQGKIVRNPDGSRTTTYFWFETTYHVLTYQKFATPQRCGNTSPLMKWDRKVVDRVDKKTRTETTPASKPKPPTPKPPKPPTPKPVPPAPGTSTIGLVKSAVVNLVIGNTTTKKDYVLTGGEFSFEVATAPKSDPTAFKVDGVVYNAATGKVKSDLGTRTVGDTVRFCEVVTKEGKTSSGWTPNVPCITLVVQDDASKNVASFLNTGVDYCINLAGLQGSVPSGWNQDGAGNCTQPAPPPAQKYQCSAHFADGQVKVGETAHLIIEPNGPMKSFSVDWGEGYAIGNDYNAYTTPGERHVVATVTYTNGTTSTCGDTVKVVPCPPPVVDVCPNLPGDQASVPEGYVLENGKCVKCPPPKQECKKGESRGKDGKCCPDDKKDEKGKNNDHGDKDRSDHGSSDQNGGGWDHNDDEHDDSSSDSDNHDS